VTRSYEPAADVALDEGTEPPSPCSRCGALLQWDESCPHCEDDAQMYMGLPNDDGGRMDWAFERERDDGH
jgi:hypothetical protein